MILFILISDKFNRDIYFIDSKDEKSIISEDTNFSKENLIPNVHQNLVKEFDSDFNPEKNYSSDHEKLAEKIKQIDGRGNAPYQMYYWYGGNKDLKISENRKARALPDRVNLKKQGSLNNAIRGPTVVFIESAIEDILLKLNHMGNSEIGIIGMGVMGKSLAKNFVSKGYRTSVFNRPLKEEIEIIPDLLREVNNANLSGYTDLKEFVNSLSIPRKIIMMIPSGKPVDDMIGSLTPLLEQDGILVDC